MGQVEISAGYNRGRFHNLETAYLDCWNDEESTWLYYGQHDNFPEIGQRHDATYNRYSIHRAIMAFDTSVLPAGAAITSVSMKLYCWKDYRQVGPDFDLVIVRGDFAPVKADYHSLLDETESRGSLNTADIETGFIYIPLNEIGIAEINREGYTKFAIRSSRDISATPPPSGTRNYIHCSNTAGYTALVLEYAFEPYFGWVEGTEFCYIDKYGAKRCKEGELTGDTGEPCQGWIEGLYFHYIDLVGAERRIPGVKEGATGKVSYQGAITETKLCYTDINGDERRFEGSVV